MGVSCITLERCLLLAREVAEPKLWTAGQLPVAVEHQTLYDGLPERSTAFNKPAEWHLYGG